MQTFLYDKYCKVIYLERETCRLFLGPEESSRSGYHFNKMVACPEEIISMWHEVAQSHSKDKGEDFNASV